MVRQQSPAEDHGVGWIIQLVAGVGMLALVTVGRPLIASQSSITPPFLWIAGALAIAAALYSRFAPRRKPTRPPPREDRW